VRTTEPRSREPGAAERARTLVATARTAALATLDESGFPLASVVSHALDAEGRPLLLSADLAGHAGNLAADPRASLTAVRRDGGDPAAAVTLAGEVVELAGREREDALATYRAARPGAADDGRLYRLDVGSVRYDDGAHHVSGVAAAEYAAAAPEPGYPADAPVDRHGFVVLDAPREGHTPGNRPMAESTAGAASSRAASSSGAPSTPSTMWVLRARARRAKDTASAPYPAAPARKNPT
jgi:hypothetical protein